MTLAADFLTVEDHQIMSLGDIFIDLGLLFRIVLEKDRAQFYAFCGEEDEEAYARARDMSLPCAFFCGHTKLSSEEWQHLRAKHGGKLALVVMGHLEFSGGHLLCTDHAPIFTNGDVCCDSVWISSARPPVIGGCLTARHYVAFLADEHSVRRKGFQGQVNTPHAFFCFHDWRDITLNLEAVLHLRHEQSDFEEPDHQYWFDWRDDVKALRKELICGVADAQSWDLVAISHCMVAGESIFNEGFDPLCLPPMNQACVFQPMQHPHTFVHSKTIADHQIVSLSEVWTNPAFQPLAELDRLQFLARRGDDEYYESERDMESLCVFFDGDARLNRDEWRALCAEHEGEALSLVVLGNLEYSGSTLPGGYYEGLAYVLGDLVCDGVQITPSYPPVIGGSLIARYYAAFLGEDDETLHSGFQGQVKTPHALFWFHDWREISLNKDAILHMMCSDNDFEVPDNPRWFYWHDDLMAQRVELSYGPDAKWSDTQTWNLEAWESCMAAGKSIFIDGFDADCLPLMNQGRTSLQQGQYQQAFEHFKAAIGVAPNYQLAWIGAADALYWANALEQAIPYAERAVALMPKKLRYLHSDAANTLALCLLRLARWDEAIKVADASISHSQGEDSLKARRLSFRVRGEAYLKRGELVQARDDLVRSVELSPYWQGADVYHWLAGLAHYKLGEFEAAKAMHQRASHLSSAFANISFEDCDGADFRYPPAIRVDWAS
ncbi:tetratricopeptide repeat protein [Chitinibacter sp. GC72]|uniref:tetratricopeptide repeat protein n=1 Tax=Chitinibacter sp. GC72 TaxID=1526917 RepID=UPI0012FB0447|nr:tetratricopeptide repeat protein [Chitinibacter sp. GC72]